MSIQGEYLHTDMDYSAYESRAYQDDMELPEEEEEEEEEE